MYLEQGQTLQERYRIVRLVSQGPDKACYRAWDSQNQAACFIKQHLDPDLLAAGPLHALAGRLMAFQHPNLPAVYDFFSVPGLGEFLVMEFIDGPDLETTLQNSDVRPPAVVSGLPSSSGLPEIQVVQWLNEINQALAYLHSQNPPFIHGDVCPGNIRLSPNGRPVLVGWSFAASPAGRPGYAAPEQAGTAPLDGRADVYSLGASLYKLLTGLTPPGSIDRMTGAANLPPARQANPRLTPEIDRLLESALQTNRNARLTDMGAFQSGLLAAYTRLSAPPPPPSGSARPAVGPTVAVPVARPPAAAPAAASAGPAGKKASPLLLILLGLLVVACLSLAGLWYLFTRPGQTEPVDALATTAAETIQAAITQNAAATALAQELTPSAEVASATPEASPLPSTPSPTAPAACGKASFIADVTIPDNTVMYPSTPFTKIWRIRNDSPCTWDESFSLVFSKGAALNQVAATPFPGKVAPGQQVDLFVNLVAPAGPGAYTAHWLLRSPENVLFGVGGSGSTLYTTILVTTTGQPDARFAYDFSANACNARWYTPAGEIRCSNTSADPSGSILVIPEAPLERGQENEPGLWLRPDQNRGDFITSEYPAYTIQPGDHFVAELSCVPGFSGCETRFVLSMLYGSGLISLGSWTERADGQTQVIDIDLAAYAGQEVRFQLRLEPLGDLGQSGGIWLLPSIRRQAVQPTSYP